MTSAVGHHVTLVELFQVVGPFEELERLLGIFVARVERDGVRGIASMQFYADRAAGEIGAVITLSDPSQFIDHMNMISGWDEFRQVAGVVKLVDMRIHGKVPPEVEAWMRQFNGPIKKLEEHVAGFVR